MVDVAYAYACGRLANKLHLSTVLKTRSCNLSRTSTLGSPPWSLSQSRPQYQTPQSYFTLTGNSAPALHTLVEMDFLDGYWENPTLWFWTRGARRFCVPSPPRSSLSLPCSYHIFLILILKTLKSTSSFVASAFPPGIVSAAQKPCPIQV